MVVCPSKIHGTADLGGPLFSLLLALQGGGPSGGSGCGLGRCGRLDRSKAKGPLSETRSLRAASQGPACGHLGRALLVSGPPEAAPTASRFGHCST